MGLVFGSKRCQKTDEFYLYGDLWWQGALRLLFFLLFSAIFVVPIGLKLNLEDNSYFTALVVTFLPFLVLGFVTFSSFFDMFYYKLNLSYLKPSLYFKGDRYDVINQNNETIVTDETKEKTFNR